ncbi:MAG: PQQ-like beta-propeller repeat protein [Muribaculaceae bacterium]|nr:PQQ-like beta-propeller repeat protein [Muribaculaceae bacterium]
MQRILYTIIAAICVLTSCSRSDKTNEGATQVENDSLNIGEPSPVIALADTVYQSASVVKYTIDCRDTITPGKIDSYTDLYATAPGALTFRNGLYRQADFGGQVTGVPSEVVVDWTFTTGSDNRSTSVGTWGGGTGWTGQPLFINWPDSMVTKFKNLPGTTPHFGKKEIIVGSLAGRVYFINYETGEASREAISVGNPIKGTVSLDPTLNGNLFVGHGVPAERPFGAVLIDLNSNSVVDVFGEDPKAGRRWGAYDSSVLRYGQFVFRPGENGTIYKLNAVPGKAPIHTALRYTVGGMAPGVESSMCIYRNYGYIGDNAGNVIAINLDTMKPVWRYNLGDDIDATIVLEEEDGVPYIYAGCEVDKQGQGTANLVKLNAINGQEIWLAKVPARRANVNEKHFDGGFYGTLLLGTGNCSDLLFANCVLNEGGQNGVFMALKKSTGDIVYQTRLKYYSWSSPVGFLNEKDELTVFTGDCAGNVYLIEPRSGEIRFSKSVGHNFESSPVVIGNTVVMGTRGDRIFRMSIK